MPTATRETLNQTHKDLAAKALELMQSKNHDYASESDPFRNFRFFGGLGILVRLSDKLARLRSFEENNEFRVADEKLIDTVLDLVNYAVIYYAYKNEDQPVVGVHMCAAHPSEPAVIRSDAGGAYYCSSCYENSPYLEPSNCTPLVRL